MTVAELINELSKYNNDLEIYTLGGDGRYEDIADFYVRKPSYNKDGLEKLVIETGHNKSKSY